MHVVLCLAHTVSTFLLGCLNGCLVLLKELLSLLAFADLFTLWENLCCDEAVRIISRGSLNDVLGHLE